jgi:hypothetical protein
MLDLDAIFNPDRVPVAPQIRPVPVDGLVIRVEDLEPEWRIDWEERAAILEYDGGHPRERAEALALSEVIRLMERAGVPVPYHA